MRYLGKYKGYKLRKQMKSFVTFIYKRFYKNQLLACGAMVQVSIAPQALEMHQYVKTASEREAKPCVRKSFQNILDVIFVKSRIRSNHSIATSSMKSHFFREERMT